MHIRLFIISFIMIATVFGAIVTPEMALTAATTHLEINTEFTQNHMNIAPEVIGKTFAPRNIQPLRDSDADRTLGYIVELDPVGFVALSGMTEIRPVIAYSFAHDFIFIESPQNIMLNMLRDDLAMRIEAISKTSEVIIQSNETEWRDYLAGEEDFIRSRSSMTVYGPWLDTEWSQGNPYNMRCPLDPETGYRCVTGCTATAMAQILNYWEYPPFVAFSDDESYYSGYTSPEIFIDAPTANDDTIVFDYAGSGDPSNSQLADLMWAAGVSVGSWYSSSGTGANVSANDYIEKWGYDEDAAEISGGNPNFYTYLSDDQIAGRPAQLSIYQDDWEGGHSIVCDGYNTSSHYFHLNMGWAGSSNGWYSLPAGMPAGYSIINSAVMQIEPAPRDDAPNTCAEAITIVPRAESSHWKDAIYRPGDDDWFTFEAVSESSYILYSRGVTNTFGAIYSSCGGELIDSSSTGISDDNFFLQFIPPTDGSYKLLVRGIDEWEFGLYTLYFRTGVGPSIDIILPPVGISADEGTNIVVQWTTSGVPDFTTVRLDYSLDGPDGPWQAIVDSTDIPFHIWEVPYITGDETDVYIRVVSAQYNSIIGVVGPITILDVSNIGEIARPGDFEIRVYPNPFNSSVSISVSVIPGLIRNPEIEIYDINGHLIDVIARREEPDAKISPNNRSSVSLDTRRDAVSIDNSEFVWQPDASLGSGVYLVRVNKGLQPLVTKRVVYLK